MHRTHVSMCPYCDTVIEAEVMQWDVFTSCPSCQKPIHIEYDFIVGDDEEEWDVFTFSKCDKPIEGFDITKSWIPSD